MIEQLALENLVGFGNEARSQALQKPFNVWPVETKRAYIALEENAIKLKVQRHAKVDLIFKQHFPNAQLLYTGLDDGPEFGSFIMEVVFDGTLTGFENEIIDACNGFASVRLTCESPTVHLLEPVVELGSTSLCRKT